MVFGNQGYFKGTVKELAKGWSFPSEELWFGQSTESTIYFHNGKLASSSVGANGIVRALADCDKF